MLEQTILKKTRIFNDLTQEELANELNISVALYCKIENNDYLPKWQVRQKIANYFKVDQTYFWSKNTKKGE